MAPASDCQLTRSPELPESQRLITARLLTGECRTTANTQCESGSPRLEQLSVKVDAMAVRHKRQVVQLGINIGGTVTDAQDEPVERVKVILDRQLGLAPIPRLNR